MYSKGTTHYDKYRLNLANAHPNKDQYGNGSQTSPLNRTHNNGQHYEENSVDFETQIPEYHRLLLGLPTTEGGHILNRNAQATVLVRSGGKNNIFQVQQDENNSGKHMAALSPASTREGQICLLAVSPRLGNR